MKALQLVFVIVVGAVCLATYATSATFHPPCGTAERMEERVVTPERG